VPHALTLGCSLADRTPCGKGLAALGADGSARRRLRGGHGVRSPADDLDRLRGDLLAVMAGRLLAWSDLAEQRLFADTALRISQLALSDTVQETEF